MDADVQIMYVPSKEKRITRHDLKVNLSSSHNRRPLSSELEACIDEIWTRRVSDNSTLWNGSKFRIASVSESSDDVTFNLGITSYKDFIGTNWSPTAEELRQLGSCDHSDTQAYMSDALGVGAFLESSDGQVVLLKRGEHLAEAPGLWDIPGGHPEPQEIVGKIDANDIDISSLSPWAVINEIFNSTLHEIVHEVNIPIESLSEPILIGIARNTTSAGRPSSEYYVRCSLLSEEIRRRYNEGTQAEADETTRITFIPTTSIAGLQTDNQSVWSQLAPSAKGCISLYILHGRPEPPYQPATIVT